MGPFFWLIRHRLIAPLQRFHAVEMPNGKDIEQGILKTLSRNKNLTLIKSHKSCTNVRKMTGDNPNLDLFNINEYIKFGQIIFIHS